MKHIKTIGKVLAGIYLAAIVIVGAWGIASWVEVSSKNSLPNPQYNNYNLLALLLND